MEVAIAGSNNGGSPFQREVREWQRIDPNTGALLTGRLEADRWINGSLNSYGKVVDSQNVSQPNGTQHSQRKQLEVLQARTSSGSMQVIRAHTVQTTSSRWTATSSSSASSSNSSSPLMTTLSHGSGGGTGYFSNHPHRFHANLCLTNESADSAGNGNNGPATDGDHLTSNFHLNHHPKQDQQKQQHHLFSTTPSLKLSNLMKSTPSITNGTSASQSKVILHKTAASHGPKFHQPFLTSPSRQKQPKTDPTTSSASSSISSLTSTPVASTRSLTTTSSGAFRFDSSRYDLPTTEAYEYVGGIGNNTTTTSGSGKIIDICSRDIDDVGDDVDDDSDVDRVIASASASRRRRETTWQSTTAALQRGRSISTEDLTSNGIANTRSDGDGGGSGGGNNIGDDDEPAEWRRVSKIRRSFQFPSTTASESSSKTSVSLLSRSRPVDLPEHTVSVSKIRAELENGRRLSTAMRNNHVDLVALDNILNGSSTCGSGTASPLTSKKKTASFLTAESLKEIRGKLKKLSDESLYRDDFVTKSEHEHNEPHEEADETPSQDTSLQYVPRSNGTLHTTNSLESRTPKNKDTSSAEWHLRRKSYGFEKMSPPDDKSMFRFENSTDSGLGRSSDLGNWSPTTDSNNSSARATVITFGSEQSKPSGSSDKVRPMVQRRLRNRTQPQSEADAAEMKRHSIAVDESQYVRENLRKTSAVHLNGFYSKDSSPQNSGFSDDNSRRQKRVEFCKTEVHFAAESGRVNIVETDGKPPPSHNFRRRRRSSSSSSTSSSSISTSSSSVSLDAIKTGLPVIHFGDECKTILDGSLDIDDEQLEDDKSPMSNVTVSIPVNLDSIFDSEYRDTDDHQDEISIRGILKNKPIKPKPYHLGENIESADALWGVQLKPVAPRSFSGERDQTEEEFKETTVSSKSVAERIRIVEERKEGAGYSTKINLNLSSSPYEWTDTGALRSSYDDQLENDFYGVGLSSLSKLSPALTDEGLKSTPLIIKTLRSANQFDEAMRRLSISSNTSSGAETTTASVTTKHVSSLSHITKATSTSSFASSLASEFKTNYTHGSQSGHANQTSLRPIAAPRLKVVGSATNSISHQLSQLRRMYDYAGLDSDDSARADEEVKGYFGGDLDDDDEDEGNSFGASELSGSWSRIKAKRTVLKIQTAKKVSHQEVPKSNIMNIELHSPLTTTIKKPESIRMQAPIAKPRTIPTAKDTTSVPSKPNGPLSQAEANDQLKIVKEARGARKLREHELSYFGVKVSSSDTTDTRPQMTTSKPKLTTTPKRSLPSRKLTTKTAEIHETETDRNGLSKKWNLPNDKPDLLRHSPILVEPQVITKTAVVAPSIGTQHRRSKSPIESSDDQTDGLYENLKKPAGPYCRQKDLERDEMILSEMTRTADQTMKALSDEATQKDLRRRSLSRRSSKPLETIEEKLTKPLPKTTTRSRTSTHRIVRECSTRPSSASSGDSRPSTPTHQRARSRSRENTEYVNVKPKTTSRCLKHRSSSRESQKSATSSADETTTPNHRVEVARKSKRSTTKDEPLLAKHHHNHPLQRSLRNSTESQDRSKVTARSSIRDRAECHDPHHSRSHRSSHHQVASNKSDVEHKRNSHVSAGDAKSSTKTSRSRPDNEKPSKSSSERVSRSKAHSSHSQSEHHHHSSKAHRSMGSKSATVSSSGNNSDTIIHSKNAHSSSASASKSTAKRSSKDRK